MRKYAMVILVILLFSGLAFPLIEMLGVFTDKSQIENGFRQASKAAIFKSYGFADRANQTYQINFNSFVKEYANIFEEALDVRLINGASIDSMSEAQIEATDFIFRSSDERYNDIIVNFQYSNIGMESECNVTVKSKYKYKTNYLKMAETANPSLAFFEIGIDRDILLVVPN